jgi:hypothetical protein
MRAAGGTDHNATGPRDRSSDETPRSRRTRRRARPGSRPSRRRVGLICGDGHRRASPRRTTGAADPADRSGRPRPEPRSPGVGTVDSTPHEPPSRDHPSDCDARDARPSRPARCRSLRGRHLPPIGSSGPPIPITVTGRRTRHAARADRSSRRHSRSRADRPLRPPRPIATVTVAARVPEHSASTRMGGGAGRADPGCRRWLTARVNGGALRINVEFVSANRPDR